MSKKLVEQRCKPCEGGVPPLSANQAQELLRALHPDWSLSDDGLAIARRFTFPAYSQTLAFANAVAWVAHREDHHPELVINYRTCEVRYHTHAIGGLSQNDFICESPPMAWVW